MWFFSCKTFWHLIADTYIFHHLYSLLYKVHQLYIWLLDLFLDVPLLLIKEIVVVFSCSVRCKMGIVGGSRVRHWPVTSARQVQWFVIKLGNQTEIRILLIRRRKFSSPNFVLLSRLRPFGVNLKKELRPYS